MPFPSQVIIESPDFSEAERPVRNGSTFDALEGNPPSLLKASVLAELRNGAEPAQAQGSDPLRLRAFRPSAPHAQNQRTSAGSCVLHLDVRMAADFDEVAKLVDFVEHLLLGMGAAPRERSDVGLALHEALINAVDHGCRRDSSKSVLISVCCLERPGILIAVRDPGGGFDPSSTSDPLQDGNLLRNRGRGIFLIRHLMDEVFFRRGGREIVMGKALTAAGWLGKDALAPGRSGKSAQRKEPPPKIGERREAGNEKKEHPRRWNGWRRL